MKPYEQRSRVGKFLARVFGYADGTLEPAEIAVKVVAVLTRIADNKHLTAYTETSKNKLAKDVLNGQKTWLPVVAARLKIHTQNNDDWQDFLQRSATSIRMMNKEERRRKLPELAGMGYQEELRAAGEQIPTLDVAKVIVEQTYQEKKAMGEIA